MDKRYLYSWLTFIGVMGVAWLMSQMDGESGGRQAAGVWTGTVRDTESAGLEPTAPAGVGPADALLAAEDVQRRQPEGVGAVGEPGRLAARGATPTIPGLLDDDDFSAEGLEGPASSRGEERAGPAQFDWEGQSAELGVVRPGASATMPLRPAGTEQAKATGGGGLTPLPAGAPAIDGSTPQRRVTPTFSMPNTQRAESTGPNLADVSALAGRAGDGAFNAANPEREDRRVDPTNGPYPSNNPSDGSSGAGRGLPLKPLSTGPIAAASSGAGVQPQFLPGERHVLRPIMRSGLPVSSAASPLTPPALLSPTGATPPGSLPVGSLPAASLMPGSLTSGAPAPSLLPAGASAAGVASAGGPASVWDAPMPGVKVGSGANLAPVAGNASVHDPLFVQAAEGLARETDVWNSQPSGGASWPAGPGTAARAGMSPLVASPPGPRVAGGASGGLRPRAGGRPRPSSGDYIWHEIQQNQTLESISLQYQGDTSLVGPIAELNRDILPDPQLLPIGRAIRVPIR